MVASVPPSLPALLPPPKRTPTAAGSALGSPKQARQDVAPFLKSLRKMLEHENEAILRWTPDGRAFEIHDMDGMAEHVLPKYFKHRKYTSFQRQLNYFNFRKWTKSKAVVCTFSNEYFVRDQPELAWRITRKKSLQIHSQPKTPAVGRLRATLPSPSAAPAPLSSLPSTSTHTSGSTMFGTSLAPWRTTEEMVISVPRSMSMTMAGLARPSFPLGNSDLAVDNAFKDYDHHGHHHHPQQHQPGHHRVMPLAVHEPSTVGHDHLEGFDWVECLMPFDRDEDSYGYPSPASYHADYHGSHSHSHSHSLSLSSRYSSSHRDSHTTDPRGHL